VNYSERLQRLRQNMVAASIDVVFLPISADLQYITGVTRDMPNFGRTLYPGQWLEGAFISQAGGPVITLPRMTAEFHAPAIAMGETRVLPDRGDASALVRDVFAHLHSGPHPNIALGNTAIAETAVALASLFPGAHFSNASDLMRPLRQIKSADEVAVMRRAGAVTEAAFAEVLKKLKIGMTETEICAEVDLQLRAHGAIGPSFTTAMYNRGPNRKFGLGHENTSRNEPLLAPVALLFDFGAAFEGYCYDYGRTVFFGEPTPEMMKIFNTIMASQAAGIAAMRVGTTCEQVDRAARTVVHDAGFGQYFRHRLGHGIGMDVHEPPFLTEGDETEIQDGMAFTVEPSILVPDGFGSRIEDIVIARKDGGEPLTRGWLDLTVIS
jgi:Xaa-Pro aminopeptidase